MKFLNMKFLALTLTALLFSTSAQAESAVSGWLKGCLIFGGASVTGTVLGVSASGADVGSPTSVIVSGALGCLVGGYLADDVEKKATSRVDNELILKNARLKNQIYGVMHDLCVLKKQCGADGVTPMGKYKDVLDRAQSQNSNRVIKPKSGN